MIINSGHYSVQVGIDWQNGERDIEMESDDTDASDEEADEDEKVSAVRPFPPPTTGVLPEVCFRRHDSGKALKICELGKTY